MKRKIGAWQEATTWREMLSQLIASPQEKNRLALAAHVKPVTLQRWAEGVNRPHLESLLMLLRNIAPDASPLFLRLLLVEFPALRGEALSEREIVPLVASEFYAHVLSSLALTPPSLCRQSMQNLILQQLLAHLDPDCHGLLVSLAICVPPREGIIVRSLCENDGVGNPPWPRDLSERLFFLGSESLVGYAVKHMRSFVINSRDEMTVLPAHWSDYERSAAAFPILRHARIAGGLLVASARDFFFTPARLTVVEEYSHLATCIFEENEFFDPAQIELMMMPRYTLQLPYFAGYPRRVVQKQAEISAQGQRAVLQKARELVMQDLEEVLLSVFLRNEITNLSE
ncbi:MAG TPA: hypothetical protein VGD98_02360 [Ktedonobacteraceae bacterium]